jgi:myo-inositol catabolism protein IolC
MIVRPQWWDLPPNTSADAGTGVSTVMLRVKKH